MICACQALSNRNLLLLYIYIHSKIKKVVDDGVAQQSCCFFVGDIMLFVGPKKLAGLALQTIAGAISAEWSQQNQLTMTLSRFNSASVQVAAKLADYQYVPTKHLGQQASCGISKHLQCGESKVLQMQYLMFAGVKWQVAFVGHRSPEAQASNDLEVDLALRWCPRQAWEGRKNSSADVPVSPPLVRTFVRSLGHSFFCSSAKCS